MQIIFGMDQAVVPPVVAVASTTHPGSVPQPTTDDIEMRVCLDGPTIVMMRMSSLHESVICTILI